MHDCQEEEDINFAKQFYIKLRDKEISGSDAERDVVYAGQTRVFSTLEFHQQTPSK